jgi:dTDP-4-dehydrorhamnose reductase
MARAEPGPVLVAGAGGLLGGAAVEALAGRGRSVLGLGRAELDVTDASACRLAVAESRPAVVVNCAAFTQVDRAEDEPEPAARVNVDGAANLARAAAQAGAKVVYLSTDFIFDGTQVRPYAEDDPPAPLNAYGRTKWAGEAAVRREAPAGHLILRTAWLFGPHGPNFVRTILRLGREKGELNVVDDQVGSPTSSLDLAAALVQALDLGLAGTFHLVNAGAACWFDLARRALDLAGLKVGLTAISSDKLNRKAVRPVRSVLDCSRIKALGVTMRPWEEALADYLAREGLAEAHG